MKKIDLDMERCCACGACAIACMDQNNIEPEEGMRPFRTVFRDDWEEDGKAQYFSIACMHCDNAPCVRACAFGALRLVEEGEIDEKASLQSMCKKLAAVQR